MKKYLLGFSAIVLAIGFSAFTTKKHATLDPDLKFTALSSTQGNVETASYYMDNGTIQFVCPSSTKVVACTILSVPAKYTHDNGESIVLNSGTPGVFDATTNPDSEPILTVHATSGSGNQKIDYLTKSDVGSGLTQFTTEGTDFTNGNIH